MIRIFLGMQLEIKETCTIEPSLKNMSVPNGWALVYLHDEWIGSSQKAGSIDTLALSKERRSKESSKGSLKT